jgi:hypothetical protein
VGTRGTQFPSPLGPRRTAGDGWAIKTLLVTLAPLGTPGGAIFVASRRLSPELPEPVRRQLGVAHRVLDVLVAEPSL